MFLCTIYIYTFAHHLHHIDADSISPATCCAYGLTCIYVCTIFASVHSYILMHATLTTHVARCRDGDNGFKVTWSLRMLTWVQCMQSLLKAMNLDLQGLWIARLARDPLLVSGLLLPVWCVGARTRFLMTRCTIPTFVNVFAGNLFIRLTYKTKKTRW